MTDGDEDAALFMRVARGDQAAFATLFDRHQKSVVRFAYRFVGSTARAEELAQEIFVKLYRSAHRYQPTARFKTFMFRVATNHCLNEARRGEYRAETSAEAAPNEAEPHAPTPEHAALARDLERTVKNTLMAMNERERAAFSMCRFEGLSYKDIAFALEATESAVKSMIHRATVQMMNAVEALNTAGAGRTGS